MKKIYNIPAVKITMLDTTHQLLSASDPNVTVNTSGSVDAEKVDVKSSTASYNVWDDDWSR